MNSFYASEQVIAESGESMKKFEDRSDGGMYITGNQAQIHLSPHEAYALWQWLSASQDAFQTDSSENQKAAIPDLHTGGPIVRTLDPRWNTLTERALQLLKEFQIEYHAHPLLEDDYTYAQG